MILLDANIILRFILANDPKLSPKAELIFKKIEQGKTKIQLTLLAFSEVVFTLEKAYKMSKAEITQKLLSLLQLNNLSIEKQNMLPEILNYYQAKNISFIDAYHIVLMNKKKIAEIYSFDRDFDKLPRTESPRFSPSSLQEQQKTLPENATELSAEDCNRSIHPPDKIGGFSASDYKVPKIKRLES